MSPKVLVLPTPADVAIELANRTAAALRSTLATQPRASLCLTGGSTPRPAYRQLASMDGIDWDRIHVFWGDERAVGPDHTESNYRLAREALLDAVDLPESNIHRIQGELGSEDAAQHYQMTLNAFFGPGGVQFDVLHLGMGGDGHTASLFPSSPALDETERVAIDTLAPPASPIENRITLTIQALAGARTTLIAAHGAGKREAFTATLDAYDDALSSGQAPPPVSRIRPNGTCLWLIDRELANGTV